MRRYLRPLPAMVAVALVLGQPVAAQEKEKTEKAEKAEKAEKKITTNEEIVIKRKTDKDEKVTIEIKGDEITVNGKPIDEYEDDNLVIRKRKSTGATIYTPFRGQSGALSYHGSPDVFADSNIPFLGVITEKDDKGAKIERVTDGSAADKAGLKEGDVITKVDETKIEDPDDLTKVVRKHKPDEKIGITYERNGKTEKATATLGKRKSPFDFTMPRIDAMPKFNFDWDENGGRAWTITGKPRLGIKAEDTEDMKGVKVLAVDEESPAEKAGIKEGDIITEFDGRKIDNVDELAANARQAQVSQKTAIKITINRNGKSQTVELKTPRKLKTANL